MIYAEYVPDATPACIRVFSNVDSHVELDKFRCLVRAPSTALINEKKPTAREHLVLFGTPRDKALGYLPPERVYATPMDRVTWERTRVEVMKRHPEPFVAER